MKSDICVLLLATIYLIAQSNFAVASFFTNYDNTKPYISSLLANYEQKLYNYEQQQKKQHNQQSYDGLNFYLIKKRKNNLQDNVNFVYLATPKKLVNLARQNGEMSELNLFDFAIFNV